MSIFSKRRDEPPHRLAGYAALSPKDIADAKRRRPDVSLDDFANRRGLAFAGSGTAAGYETALPGDAQLQFNVMHGAIGPERHGCLFHWVRPWPVWDGDPGVGTFYAKVWWPKVSWKPSAADLPYVGWLFELFRKPPSTENTYDEDAIGVPCTVVLTHTPEAASLPKLTIDNWPKPRWTGGHREPLEPRGLRGWTLLASDAPPRAVVDRLLSGPLRDVLVRGSRHELYLLKLDRGVLSIVRNGFAKTDDELESLLTAADIAGAAVRDAVLAETGSGAALG